MIEILADLKDVVTLAVANANRLAVIPVGLGAPIVTGFDLLQLEAAARLKDIVLTDGLFEDLRVIEDELVAIFRERSAQP